MKDSGPKIEDFIHLPDGLYRSIVSLSQLPLYPYIGKHNNHLIFYAGDAQLLEHK